MSDNSGNLGGAALGGANLGGSTTRSSSSGSAVKMPVVQATINSSNNLDPPNAYYDQYDSKHPYYWSPTQPNTTGTPSLIKAYDGTISPCMDIRTQYVDSPVSSIPSSFDVTFAGFGMPTGAAKVPGDWHLDGAYNVPLAQKSYPPPMNVDPRDHTGGQTNNSPGIIYELSTGKSTNVNWFGMPCYIAINIALRSVYATALHAAIGDSDTTMSADFNPFGSSIYSPYAFKLPFDTGIESEQVRVSAISPVSGVLHNFTIDRGVNGTTSVSHPQYALLRFWLRTISVGVFPFPNPDSLLQIPPVVVGHPTVPPLPGKPVNGPVWWKGFACPTMYGNTYPNPYPGNWNPAGPAYLWTRTEVDAHQWDLSGCSDKDIPVVELRTITSPYHAPAKNMFDLAAGTCTISARN